MPLADSAASVNTLAVAISIGIDHAGVRRLHGLEGLADDDVERALRQLQVRRTGAPIPGPQHYAITDFAVAGVMGGVFGVWTAAAVDAAAEADAEAERITALRRWLGRSATQWVGYDLGHVTPVLRLRALRYQQPIDGPAPRDLAASLAFEAGGVAPLDELLATLGLPHAPMTAGDADTDTQPWPARYRAVQLYLLWQRMVAGDPCEVRAALADRPEYRALVDAWPTPA